MKPFSTGMSILIFQKKKNLNKSNECTVLKTATTQKEFNKNIVVTM